MFLTNHSDQRICHHEEDKVDYDSHFEFDIVMLADILGDIDLELKNTYITVTLGFLLYHSLLYRYAHSHAHKIKISLLTQDSLYHPSFQF